MKPGLKKFLVIVKKELNKAEKNHLQAQKSASEVAASAAHSPSQSGDRFHSQSTADLAQDRVESLKKLKEEIESETPILVEKDGETFFIVRNVTFIPGVKLISTNSTVGKDLL